MYYGSYVRNMRDIGKQGVIYVKMFYFLYINAFSLFFLFVVLLHCMYHYLYGKIFLNVYRFRK